MEDTCLARANMCLAHGKHVEKVNDHVLESTKSITKLMASTQREFIKDMVLKANKLFSGY